MILVVLSLAGCAGKPERSNLLDLFAVDGSKVDPTDRNIENTYDALTLLRWAEASYVQGDFAVAASEYRRFLDMYPSHTLAPFARYQMALSYDRQIDHVNRDPTPRRKAEAAFQGVIDHDPAGSYAPDARRRLADLAHRRAEQAFNVGLFYYKKEAWSAAIARFLEALPSADPALAPKISALLAQAYEATGQTQEAEAIRQKGMPGPPSGPPP